MTQNPRVESNNKQKKHDKCHLFDFKQINKFENMQDLGNYQVDVTQKKPSFFGTLAKNVFPYASGIISGLLDYRAQKKSNERNLQQQKELAAYRYQQDKSMYQDALDYNTPAMQMKRFREAGLNPNLIYSRGDSGSAPAAMPKYPEMSAEMSLPSPIKVPKLSAYYDTEMMKEQLKQNRTQSDILALQKYDKWMEYDAKMIYLFDQAYAKAKEAGYKKDKATFDQEVMNTFKSTYQTSQVDKWAQEAPKLNIYQWDARNKEIDNKVKQKNLDFLSNGLPWMLPLNMFLSTMMRMR